MALLPIVQYPDPRLAAKAEPVVVFDDALRQLAADMAETMYEAPGVEMAEEAGMTVDQEGFKALMEEQKVRARKAREALGDLGWAGIEFGKDGRVKLPDSVIPSEELDLLPLRRDQGMRRRLPVSARPL